MNGGEVSGDGSELRRPLVKQHSWSPDIERDEAWARRRKGCGRDRSTLGRSVTDDDLDELRGCIELGFGIELDSPDYSAVAARLRRTIPALDLYYAVRKSYGAGSGGGSVSGSSPSRSSMDESSAGSPLSIFSPDDSPDVRKTRLRQWAQVVACSVRQRY